MIIPQESHLIINAKPVQAEMLINITEYWESQRGNKELPSRNDIDPLDFPYALGNVTLIEVIGERFRFRLDGVNMAAGYGGDYTGRYADELQPEDYRDSILYLYRQTIAARRPVNYYRSVRVGKHVLSYEGVCLPLSHNDNTVNMLMDVMQDQLNPTILESSMQINYAAGTK